MMQYPVFAPSRRNGSNEEGWDVEDEPAVPFGVPRSTIKESRIEWSEDWEYINPKSRYGRCECPECRYHRRIAWLEHLHQEE